MIKILFVCHGNICRSPMSEYLLKDLVEKQNLTSHFEIASAATSSEEIWNGTGNPIYPPAQAELRKHGIGKTAYTNFSKKRARQVTKEDYGIMTICSVQMQITSKTPYASRDRMSMAR